MKRCTSIVLAGLSLIALAACSDGTSDSGGTETTTAVSTTVADAALDPERVLLAASLIALGDIDRAVAQGLVTPDEVDAAADALENGTLGQWTGR